MARSHFFDVPGATDTYILGINDQGTIVGLWDAQSEYYVPHGYFGAADGRITIFDPPDSVDIQSALIGDNDSVGGGYCTSDTGPLLGYIMAPDGAFTTFTLPGDATNTIVSATNANGDIASTLGNDQLLIATGNPVNVYESFLWANGSVNGLFPVSRNPIAATGINDSGQICGYVNNEGCLRNADGSTSLFQVDSLPAYAYSINQLRPHHWQRRSRAAGWDLIRFRSEVVASERLMQSQSASGINANQDVPETYETFDTQEYLHGFLRTMSARVRRIEK
jgi:hypothetical protein